MRRWITALAIVFTCSLCEGYRAQESGTPADLRAVADGARAKLCALYAVSPDSCAAPVAVDVVATSLELPEGWRGIPPYAAGAADPAAGRVVIVLSRCGAYPYGDPGQSLRHELSHVMLYRALGFHPPRWFDEGLAMRAAADWSAGDGFYAALALPSVSRGTWGLDRVERDFSGGEGSVRRSYALAKGFMRDLFKDDASLTAFIQEARRDRSVEMAFRIRFGASPDGVFAAWARNLPWWGEWLVTLTSPGTLWLLVTALFLAAAAAALWRRLRRRALMDDEDEPGGPDAPWVQ